MISRNVHPEIAELQIWTTCRQTTDIDGVRTASLRNEVTQRAAQHIAMPEANSWGGVVIRYRMMRGRVLLAASLFEIGARYVDTE